MDEQLTFEFEQKPTIKGFPELRWTGKRPYRSTQYYPAQLRETYGEEQNGWINKIFWGDNLQVMSHLLKEYRGKIDLIYIDPPFDSKADYKKKIEVRGVGKAESDNTSFEEKQYGDIWTNDEYLQFMYERLLLMRELLSDKGSIFMHCDWHKNHHLRCLMDEVFGSTNFVNEIAWCYFGPGSPGMRQFNRKHDNILWYSKIYNAWKFNADAVRVPHDEKTTGNFKQGLRGSGFIAGDYNLADGKIPEDWWEMAIAGRYPNDGIKRVGYPTEKPFKLLERIISAATDEGDIVADFFMGSGVTQMCAMRMGRRFIGADINLGSIQATTKRLLAVTDELNSECKPFTYKIPQLQLSMVAEPLAPYLNTANINSKDELSLEDRSKVNDFFKSKGMDTSAIGENVKYTGFEVYNVNNYDFFRNPVEAHDLLIAALEIQPFPQSEVWDGELDGRMVKIMPVNRIATKADLKELLANLPYKAYEKRKEENPNQPVERITIVCMGHEPDLKGALEQELIDYKVDIQIMDILRDKADLQLKRDSEAEIVREGSKLVIRAFYPMNLMQKLSLQKEYVEDWRQLVDSIMIDWNYDGVVMQPTVTDVPGKNEMVEGIYDIPASCGTIKVKITDLLSESLEVEVHKMATEFDQNFSFNQQLWYYYTTNRGKIRSRYNDLTRKFLAYNDSEENPNAFLRKPQFEALEMYVFVKEFMNNKQVYEMFDDWRYKRDCFSDVSYYAIDKGGQMRLFDAPTEKQTDTIFKQMKKYREDYPNYIYALTMGLGKTILMATCIFYEFLLAKKYPEDKRFCHNALVFAPDKTVLQSLREIMTFDKTKVVPPEYARVLDSNIKFHFLDETGTILHTIDDSDFNIVISNTQKIIVKKKRKKETPGQMFFNGYGSLLSAVYGAGNDDEEDVWDDTTLMDNQRFKKLCRLPQLGVYVDEAHHLFGADLEKQIRSSGANKTSLRDTINLLAANTSIVACYNYTGTPYVKNQLLPEVVYAYGLRESIWNGFLKDADPLGFENVKSEEFLTAVVSAFWEKYSGHTYEGLNPKLAIYAAGVEEAAAEVKPVLEKILAKLGIPTSKILLNVGDAKYTRNDDIRDFNNLDVCGTEGNEKQFIILVEKGKEGWNCRSLFGVALFRSPKSKIFVLQATMRCLRAITDERLTATVFLSKENYNTLDDELHKNFNMEIKDIKNSSSAGCHKYQVRVLPPPRTITLKRVWHEYTLHEKEYSAPVDFGLIDADLSKYASIMYERDSLARDTTVKEKNIDYLQENMKYSVFSLTGEVARYLNISCILAASILHESVDGIDTILGAVNRYNAVLDDYIIPVVFHALFDITSELKTEDRELVLLREPKDVGYYEFSAKDDLVLTNRYPGFTPEQIKKSFHADTYCFDSIPEKECFMQYITSGKVAEIYFTGMFTSNQGDLSVHYYDPESSRIRQYYPDFLARMADGSYQLIEVKGDNRIDDTVVKAKQTAAEEMAVASGVEYLMYAGSRIINSHILDDKPL